MTEFRLEKLEQGCMRKRFLRNSLSFLFHRLGRIEATGLENIPAYGGMMVAINHLSRLDGPLFFSLVERPDITALVALKYRKNLIFRWIIESANGIWLNRERLDAQALRTAWNYLAAGGILGIAPEGTRSKTGGLQTAKSGVAYLATKANAPILPVAMWGEEKVLKNWLRFRRPKICVRVGKSFTLPPLNRKKREQDLQRNTDEIMCRIAALLPAAYRGVYVQHPRLIDLLQTKNPV